jgi:hypothetical protein
MKKKVVRNFFDFFFCRKNAGGAKGMTKLYEKSWWDTYPKENALYTILFENFGSRGTALSFPARPAHSQLPKR